MPLSGRESPWEWEAAEADAGLPPLALVAADASTCTLEQTAANDSPSATARRGRRCTTHWLAHTSAGPRATLRPPAGAAMPTHASCEHTGPSGRGPGGSQKTHSPGPAFRALGLLLWPSFGLVAPCWGWGRMGGRISQWHQRAKGSEAGAGTAAARACPRRGSLLASPVFPSSEFQAVGLLLNICTYAPECSSCQKAQGSALQVGVVFRCRVPPQAGGPLHTQAEQNKRIRRTQPQLES